MSAKKKKKNEKQSHPLSSLFGTTKSWWWCHTHFYFLNSYNCYILSFFYFSIFWRQLFYVFPSFLLFLFHRFTMNTNFRFDSVQENSQDFSLVFFFFFLLDTTQLKHFCGDTILSCCLMSNLLYRKCICTCALFTHIHNFIV